jgi:phosphoserine aminotransferase
MGEEYIHNNTDRFWNLGEIYSWYAWQSAFRLPEENGGVADSFARNAQMFAAAYQMIALQLFIQWAERGGRMGHTPNSGSSESERGH